MTRSADDSLTSQALQAAIEAAAQREGPVIITGERGSGRMHTAKAIHDRSARRRKRFVDAQFDFVPSTLHHAELFGWVRGPFRGVVGPRPGRIQSAVHGTLSLRGVAESVQEQLVGALKKGRVDFFDGRDAYDIPDVRLMVVVERFQPGTPLIDFLAERPDTNHIAVPPLRERGAEIVPLFLEFTRQHAATAGVPYLPPSADTLGAVQDYRWPGNVSELIEVAQCLVAAREEGPLVLPLPDKDR